MIVSYRQEDGTVEEVSTDDLSAIESSVIESATGLDWDDVDTALRHQAPTAMRAVLWVFRKRQQPTLRFSEFDLPGWKRRTKAQLEYAEIFDMVEALMKNPEMTDELVEGMTKHMRVMAYDPADVDRAFDEAAPKAQAAATPPEPAPSPDAASETSSTSTGL
ncbi:hypothetical protein OHB41_25795 [Streptomyces sp. NBC_01571]|uniref:hypothetical protein n=1 Tax=Streptomyces sp. NBC_01571 TaxID=2975883 RepID=UPI00225BBC7B|nr:hypothetical protein [Streptomyces sp. NBC_01571]MCX4576524.1 hypothetical protein [Streptomyces sp. NBC_01571]